MTSVESSTSTIAARDSRRSDSHESIRKSSSGDARPIEESRSREFSASPPLSGEITIAGDKSISHRALILSALAVGESKLSGLLESEDIFATAAALRAMGAQLERESAGRWSVHGVGVGGLLQPQTALDMGNSGTSARLLLGLVASHALTVTFLGDASLSRRPMRRVAEPLTEMGADIQTAPNGGLPLRIRGLCPAVPISYRLPIASAQVKSAILLAGLNIAGVTEVIEPIATRDHSERMLRAYGADISCEMVDELKGETVGQVRRVRLRGEAELQPQSFNIAGDVSSAAFFVVAALLVPDSDIMIRNVGLNPTRCGLLDVLKEMGGDIEISNQRESSGEAVGDVHVRHSALRGIDIEPSLVPRMIDEFPIFFVAASLAQGRSRAYGLQELRVKESDRLRAMAQGLQAIGVAVEESESSLFIDGRGGDFFAGGATIAGQLDHRICMSFAIAGLVARAPIVIDDMRPVATSFPEFETSLAQLQAASVSAAAAASGEIGASRR